MITTLSVILVQFASTLSVLAVHDMHFFGGCQRDPCHDIKGLVRVHVAAVELVLGLRDEPVGTKDRAKPWKPALNHLEASK